MESPPSFSTSAPSFCDPPPTVTLLLWIQRRGTKACPGLVCESSLSASTRRPPLSSDSGAGDGGNGDGVAGGDDGGGPAQGASRGFENLPAELLGRRKGLSWKYMGTSMRESDRDAVKFHLTLTYGVCEVGNGDDHLLPHQVGQASINLFHDVLKVFSPTTHLVSHQESPSRCLSMSGELTYTATLN